MIPQNMVIWVTRERSTNEGIVFELYIGASEAQIRDPESGPGQVRLALASKSEAERKRMCMEFIKKLNARNVGDAV